MERQYIGARYVPMFANPIEWDNQRTFEPLTIVTYMGASYTSKKRVPAGVLPTNGEYWVVTGNYNAQVEEYRQSVEQLKKDFEGKTGRVILFIGDSYGDNPRVTNTWGAECAAAMKLGDNEWHNLCVSGASFVKPNGHHYIDQVRGYTNGRDNVTDIVLLAGTNDMGTDRTTILLAATELMNYIRANYKNAKVHAGFNSLTINGASNPERLTAFGAYNSLGFMGYCVIPNVISVNHKYSDLEDGHAHPNETANKRMGWALASYLSGGNFVYNALDSGAVTFESAGGFTVTGVNAQTTIDQAGAILHLNIARLVLRVDEPTLWANESNRVIGKFVSDFMITGNRLPVSGVQFAYQEGGEYKVGYGTFTFNSDGTVSLVTLGNITPNVIVLSGDFWFDLINC